MLNFQPFCFAQSMTASILQQRFGAKKHASSLCDRYYDVSEMVRFREDAKETCNNSCHSSDDLKCARHFCCGTHQ